ncbi:hypothetical protein IEQ34_009912 [Dendrobium chrysotoxum]|uniref:Uncharacterized protein n=1 Tax=Dendrobium chrysotoxum TaxID=161865 RepID=A0AAV7H1Z1_DENCH|nr:hypothetical protein IEQ34_009912 [Dendrobium chrysotoxum]
MGDTSANPRLEVSVRSNDTFHRYMHLWRWNVEAFDVQKSCRTSRCRRLVIEDRKIFLIACNVQRIERHHWLCSSLKERLKASGLDSIKRNFWGK